TDTTLKDKTGKSLYEESIIKGNSTYRKEFRVRMWIAEDVNMALPENHNKVFKVRINIYANVGVKESPKKLLADELVKNLGTNGTIYEPVVGGTKYIRSTKADTAPNLVNNYVWWSGMMWRVFAINPDGSMKIITDDNVSALPFHNNSNVYATSYIKEWLETYFYPKLNGSKDTVLKQNNDFCIDRTDDANSVRTTCTSKLSNLKVGLLTLDEYNIVKNGSNTNYLNNGTYYWLMTPRTSDASSEWYAYSDVGSYKNDVSHVSGGRSVTVFAQAVTISGGNGTLGTPYKITGDTAFAVSGTKLNLRHTGEFINYDNKLWRIMEVENGLTKVIYDGATAMPSGSFGLNNLDWATMKERLDGIGISTTKIVQNQIWQRGYMSWGDNVLTTSLASGNPVTSTFGLPKMGEMWASQNNNKTANYAKFMETYWLMTPYTSGTSYEWNTNHNGSNNATDVSNAYGSRPVFLFKSDVIINSGDGTPNSPYTLQ
ncbi:MAG: hypothetical protein RR161_02340, partial [Bacilli bacterium]